MPVSATKIHSAPNPQSGLPLPTAPLLGFVLAILTLLILAYARQSALSRSEESVGWVNHTLEVIEEIQTVHGSLKDAENGQRGYLVTGLDEYLAPYETARTSIQQQLEKLRSLTNDNAQQQTTLASVEQLIEQRLRVMKTTIDLAQGGNSNAAIALVRSGQGARLMQSIRSLLVEMDSTERNLLALRRSDVERSNRNTSLIMGGGLTLLFVLIMAAAAMTSRDYRLRQTHAWLRSSEADFGARIRGDQCLEKLGEAALSFLAERIGALVGTVYVLNDDTAQRIAGFALPPNYGKEILKPGEGLLGQAAKQLSTLHVVDVPEAYLPLNSSLGKTASRELLIAPAVADGIAYAVLEIGFQRSLRPEDEELVELVAESLAIAVRSARDRLRLQELLAETQRQTEELQTQQEELRVTNSELQVQARLLKESQSRLEQQQAELEQTNSQLEEQTQALELQRDALREAQTTLARHAAELERVNQYKSEFLANMSHELRTPLNSTLILAKILSDNKPGNLTDEQIKYAQTISSAGHDLLALINDILDLSKIEAGKVDVEPEQIAVKSAMDALIKPFEPLAVEKRIALKTTIAPGTPEQFTTDRRRFGQIMKNLLSNAFKFTEHGLVSVHINAMPGERIAFAVSDTGIGIAPQQMEIIFEAFRQADGSTHRKFGGTGLGLAISRDLARLLGGELTVQSTLGTGSTFTLVLPYVYIDAIPALTTAVTVTGAQLITTTTGTSGSASAVVTPADTGVVDDRHAVKPDSRVILVVEDDVRFAEILCELAHELDFQCIVTHSAAEALKAVEQYRPSGIVLDINLPDQSGLGVLDRLKRDPHTRHIPVHIASAMDFTREALELGAVGYVVKPVQREQLVTIFRRLEAKLSQALRRVLVVEDDDCQRESICDLLRNGEVEIKGVGSARDALAELQQTTFDCMVLDLHLPDLTGYELLERMGTSEDVSFPPVVVYTGSVLSQDEEQRLRRFSKSIIIKDARSPERLLDEVTLFLHQVESSLPLERQRMLRAARNRDEVLDGRRILVVEDDVRNIFALSSLLEPAGAKIEIARNGREALELLARRQDSGTEAIDLVLMDIMMPEMDGLTAMREIRKQARWQKLPIIALTAKTMKDDHEQCLAAGANDYIAKPLDVERLLSLVRVWMPR